MKQVKAYLIIAAHIVLGMAVLLGMQSLFTGLARTVAILTAFLVINIADVWVLKLHGEFYKFWSLMKMHYLLYGVAAGIILATMPAAIGVIVNVYNFSDFHVDIQYSPAEIITILLIVCWEEFWFRGVFLNYCGRSLPAVHLSLLMGLLFVLIHLLNPEIDLLKEGPSLFFAGALLTALYLYFENIWLPIGVHFGNNVVASRIIPKEGFFSNSGYLYAIILSVLLLALLYLIKRDRHLQPYIRR